jgi:hypothetical protein
VASSSGSASRHTSATIGQRGENEQPAGRFISDGGAPLIGVSRLPTSPTCGMEPMSPTV